MMDQMTLRHSLDTLEEDTLEQPRPKRRAGRSGLKLVAFVVLLVGALGIGYRAGEAKWPLPAWFSAMVRWPAGTASTTP